MSQKTNDQPVTKRASRRHFAIAAGPDQIRCFRDVVDLWPNRVRLGQEMGVDERIVSKWWQNDHVPPKWWLRLVDTERAKAAGVDVAMLGRFLAEAKAEANP
jgi:hypothetical protein